MPSGRDKRKPAAPRPARARAVAKVPEPYDVAILGGGVAGAAAARLLAAWGRKVVVLTRPSPPPALAESLPPSTEKLLARAGLLTALNEADFIRFNGHTVRWGGGDARIELFHRNARGWQVPRDQFDKVLLDAAEKAGAEIRLRANVRGVTISAGSRVHTVRFEEGKKRSEITAHWVLDCTGRAGPVAWRGTRVAHTTARTMAIVGTWERKGAWPLEHDSHTVVESFEGGWAWSVPLSRTRRQVTVMIDPGRTSVAPGAKLPATYKAELGKTQLCLALTQGARMIGKPFARDASSYESTQVSANRALLVGDAASFADPLSSFGVKKALASAWLAAVVVRSAIEDPARGAAGAALFEYRERAMAAGIRRDLASLARDASTANTPGFWADRAGIADGIEGIAPEIDAFRSDIVVRRAHEEIRRRPALAVRPTTSAPRVSHPMIEDDLIVVRSHFLFPGLPVPLRYLRNVDLISLADLAPSHDDVPALHAAYRRAGGGGDIPDMVGALAVLVAKGALRFS
jgi:flavin-dependent dehydrogenase